MKILKVWLKYTNNSFQQTLADKVAVSLLLSGKFFRIVTFVIFLNFLFSGSKNLASYSREQIIFFYLTFVLVDGLAQFLFRESYRFRELVVSGNLDMVLVKPIHPIVRVLFGGMDVLDLFVNSFIIAVIFYFGVTYLQPTFEQWVMYILFIFNSLIIAAALHIFLLGFCILTFSIDHLVMIYRDLTSMLRIPVNLYIDPIRIFLTFIIPIGIMLTFPAQALLGLLSANTVILCFVFSIFYLFLSLKFWGFALNKYQSASS